MLDQTHPIITETALVDSVTASLPVCHTKLHVAYAQLGFGTPTPETAKRVVHEFHRWLPSFLVACLLAALSPTLQKRFTQHYRKNPRLLPHAEEVSSDAIERLLRALFGHWSRGNVGAFVAAIRHNVGVDFERKMQRTAFRHQTTDPTLLDLRPSPVNELLQMLDDLPEPMQAILIMKASRSSEAEIAAALQIPLEQVQAVLRAAKCQLRDAATA